MEFHLEGNLALFEPKSRHAILVNSYGASFPGYSQGSIFFAGNRNIYELEGILSGHFAQFPNEFRGENMNEKLLLTFVDILEMRKNHRKNIQYDSVTRVLPGYDMRRKMTRTLNRIANLSDESTLTFMYLNSHGEIGSVALERSQQMSYQELLDRLDRIKGKKVIVALACYSGSLLDELEKRENRDHYIAITLTNNAEKGTARESDYLNDMLIGIILGNKPISDLRLPAFSSSIVGHFDVRL